MTAVAAALHGLGTTLAELAPVVRRAVSLDPAIAVRLRRTAGRSSAVLLLPFGVLAGRTVAAPEAGADANASDAAPVDVTVDGSDLLAWLDGERAAAPDARDERWRGTLPPVAGWQRVDLVPADVLRSVVQAGARTAVGHARRAADAVLDAPALEVSDDRGTTVSVSLRTLSGLMRMGFAPAGSEVAVDRCGRWVRVAALYGSVYAERPGGGLSLAG
jgi:hypothetical protein